MGLRARLLSLVAVLALAVAGLGGLALFQLNDINTNGRVVVQVAQPANTAAAQLSNAVLDIQLAVARYALGDTKGTSAEVEAAHAEALAQLDTLTELTKDYGEVAAFVEEVRTNFTTWYDGYVLPVLDALEAGNTAEARSISSSTQATDSAEALEQSLVGLESEVVALRATSSADTADAVRILRFVEVVSFVLLLLLVLATWLGLRRWVLVPLDSVGDDLREVAGGDLEHPIDAVGPREIKATARDAEDMRRRLLTEVDEAIAAREALDHRGPVVAAIRRELRAGEPPEMDGYDSAGVVLSAEGVLAGDWFELLELPDRRMALVVVDVSGHGPLAGLAALRLKYAMTGALRSGSGARTAIEAGAAVLAKGERERFATGVVITVSPTGELVWCNAGHPTPFIVSARSSVERLETTGPMMSWLGGTWSSGRAVLPEGGVLVAVSDGLLESRDTEGVDLATAWSDEDLAAALGDRSSARDIIEELVAGARARADKWRVDDVTVVAVQRLGNRWR